MQMEQIRSNESMIIDGLPQKNNGDRNAFFERHWKIIEDSLKVLMIKQQKLILGPIKRSVHSLICQRYISQLKSGTIILLYKIFNEIIEQKLAKPYVVELHHYLVKVIKNIEVVHYLVHEVYEREALIKQVYKAFCHELINNNSVYEQIGSQFMVLIDKIRNGEVNDELSWQIIKDIKDVGLFLKLQGEFIERSKNYYVEKAQQAPKNIEIFKWINQYLKREEKIFKILQPSQNTVYYLEKQFIIENYYHILQYFDHLVTNISTNSQQLQILWDFTKRLHFEDKFENRLSDVVTDAQKCIKNHSLEEVPKIRDHFKHIITKYLQNNRKLHSVLNQTLQKVLYELQSQYNTSLVNKAIERLYPIKTLTELFKISTNKLQFINLFQDEFAKKVLSSQIQQMSLIKEQLSYYSIFIDSMSRECGGKLCENINTMISDVWDGNKLLSYSYNYLNCMVISTSWPSYIGNQFIIADEMREIRDNFQVWYNSKHTNGIKFKWCYDYGLVTILFKKIQCKFSQLQASIILILNKSIRPMRTRELSEVLGVNQTIIITNLKILLKQNIILSLQSDLLFELNDDYHGPGFNYVSQINSVGSPSKKSNLIRDVSIIVQGAIIRILKNRKTMTKPDLSLMITKFIKTFKPTVQQIYEALKNLEEKTQLSIDTRKGIIKYIQ